jgi:hypothetical protein
MPCICLVNSSIFSPSVTPGDQTITRGSDNEGDNGLWNYYYNFSSGNYFVPASDLSIPNGATIQKLAFELDTTQSGTTTFTINNVDVWLYSHPTATEFPVGLQVNGYSSSDTTYNSGITNYTQVHNNGTLSYTQLQTDPNRRYIDFTFNSPFTYTGGALAVNVNNKDSNYIPGTASSPGWIGDSVSHSGRFFARRQNDTLGAYSPTDIASIYQGFKPNIKIYWT